MPKYKKYKGTRVVGSSRLKTAGAPGPTELKERAEITIMDDYLCGNTCCLMVGST